MHTLAAALVLTSVLCAQSVPHPTTIPKAATGAYGGTPSPLVLGRTGGRVQYWYRGDNIPSPPICLALGPRAARGATAIGRTQSIEITMANTTVGFYTMSKTFAQNLGTSPTVVFTRKNVSLPTLPVQQDPDSPVLWFLLDVPFVFFGPHFVVDFDLGPALNAVAATPSCDSLISVNSAGNHMSSDASCGGALEARSTAASYDLTLSGAPALQPAWFILSANATAIGSTLLPFKLDGVGMTGCVLGVDPLVLVPGTTNASGSATLSVPFLIPPGSLPVYAQVLHPTTTNPAGLALTNVARSVLGTAGYCTFVFSLTADGPVAQSGPVATNTGACLLMKP